MARKSPPGIVFWDILMPELDGLQATAAIREFESQVGRKTPIVAMTAHAMKGDRERCLDAGMDEYLTKPIRGKRIAEMFTQLDLRPAAAAAEPAAESAASSDGDSLINWADALASVDGDPDLLRLVIDAFAGEVPKLIEQATAAIQAADATTLHRTGHTMKGALLSLGVEGLAKTAKVLEDIGAAGTTDGAQDILQQLAPQMEQAVRELQAYEP